MNNKVLEWVKKIEDKIEKKHNNSIFKVIIEEEEIILKIINNE